MICGHFRHYDDGSLNPFGMPWEKEIWNDRKNNNIDLTIGIYNYQSLIDFSSNNQVFIGIELSKYKLIGGTIKIGFNISI